MLSGILIRRQATKQPETRICGREDALYLRGESKEVATRTFGMLEGQPLETSYGEDLYRQIFDLNELYQHRPSADAALAIGVTDRDQVKP